MRKLSICILLMISGGLYAQPQSETYTFNSICEQQEFEKALKEFRCVTCPNQNIAESQAPVAKAMQDEIYHRLKKGESIDTIRDYLQFTYGDYVLYRPLMNRQTWVLWLSPLFMFFIGGFIWFKIFHLNRNKS